MARTRAQSLSALVADDERPARRRLVELLLARRLNPLEFTRIHRSAIVAIERISRLEPHTHGDFIVVLRDGARLRVSRTYRAVLEARLGQSL
jgi:hypothetical protein